MSRDLATIPGYDEWPKSLDPKKRRAPTSMDVGAFHDRELGPMLQLTLASDDKGYIQLSGEGAAQLAKVLREWLEDDYRRWAWAQPSEPS